MARLSRWFSPDYATDRNAIESQAFDARHRYDRDLLAIVPGAHDRRRHVGRRRYRDGAYRWIEAPLSPVISFLSKIPPTAMMPIYFILVGTDQKMFTAMVALGIFFTMAQSIYQAVQKDVSDDAINKAYTLGASDAEILWEVIWKQILPRVLENIRLQIGPAMIFLLAAEMIVGDQGMGYRIRMESRILNISVVYIYLAILGATGLLMEWGLLMLRRKLCPWFGA
jgi:NitT/TauT family transport system permease protein